MDFKTTETHESKTCEGVTFTVRTLNVVQRAARDLEIAEHNARAQELLAKYIQAGDDKDPVLLARSDVEFGMIHNAHIVPAVVRAGLVEIAGLVADGHAVTTADQLLAAPIPQELMAEIFEHCRGREGFNQEKEKNSPSPGISAGQEDGETENSTANSASTKDTTIPEIVIATSPPT